MDIFLLNQTHKRSWIDTWVTTTLFTHKKAATGKPVAAKNIIKP